MNAIFDFISNSLTQSLLLGPLMGVFFSAIFAGLNKSPGAQVPATVFQTKEVFVTKVVVKSQYHRKTDDGAGFLIVGGLALLFVIWKYAIYFDMIQYYLGNLIFTVLSFSIATIIISLLKGQYTSGEWWSCTAGPLISLCASIYLLNLAKNSFDPSIQQGALNNSFWTFYSDWLSEYGRNFMFAHVSGIVLLAIVVLSTAFILIHYLSLMNQRSSGMMHGFWFFLAKSTSFFSGRFWVLFNIFLLGTVYTLISPDLAPSWLTHR